MLHTKMEGFGSDINHPVFIAAVKSPKSKTESSGRADREGEDPEQQGLLLQAAGGTSQTQTSHFKGESHASFWKPETPHVVFADPTEIYTEKTKQMRSLVHCCPFL